MAKYSRLSNSTAKERYSAEIQEKIVRGHAFEYCSVRPRMSIRVVINAINKIAYSDIPTYHALADMLDRYFEERGEAWFAEAVRGANAEAVREANNE